MYEFIYLDIVYGRTDNGMLSFRNKTGEAEFKISFFEAKVSLLSIWHFRATYAIIWKSIIFPACLILTQQQLYLFFYYIQENLNAFNSLLIAERSADAVLSGRRPVQSLCISV